MIKCFSFVLGHKNAQELVIDLNGMKSNRSSPFYIKYNRDKDYSVDDSYLVVGNVTKKDWNELNLESDFMEADII